MVNPGKPTDKSFAELVNLVKNHLNPRLSSIVYRSKFNSRFRQQRETIQQKVAELRNSSEHCEFGDQLEKMLRDRLVCGVNDERIQRRLLAESQLEFKKAMELSTAMETAEKNTRDLQNGNPSARENPEEQTVNRVTKDPPKEPKLPPWNSKQPNAPETRMNVFVVGASFTMPISAGIKTKSALNTTRRVTKRNLAATVNQVVEMAENLEIRIIRRQQKRRRRKNTQCFT